MSRLAEVQQLIADPRIKVVSVDVFDTLLLRDTTPEATRFESISRSQVAFIGQITGRRVSSTDFYYLRQEAARAVYHTKTPTNQAREATWREIFAVMLCNLGIEPDEKLFDKLLSIELDYETQRMKLNERLLGLMRKAQDLDKQILCVSDMYLASETIGQLIDRCAHRTLGLNVYSSADRGYGKKCGAIFTDIKNDCGVEFEQILHCGDNWFADFSVPRSLGITAVHLPRSTPWRLVLQLRALWFHQRVPLL